MVEPLYEQDFLRWTEQQARAIRDAGKTGTNPPIDWENVAEEIDSLGRSQRSELRNRIQVIVEHLLKLQASPAIPPRRAWENTVRSQRIAIAGLLDDSPSLRREVAGMIDWALVRTRPMMAEELQRWGERPRLDPASLCYSEAQVLGDWLPDLPAASKRATGRRG